MNGTEKPEAILRSLPEWFGIEASILEYRRDIETMETFIAESRGRRAGFLTLRAHNPRSAEIRVMGVLPDLHRRGIGRALADHAVKVLRQRSVEFLQVKTLGPSRESEEYARTRRFYESLGFVPLEENLHWGAANPCLVMVMHLRGSACSP